MTIRARYEITAPSWPPTHPAWLRCSSLTYSRYAHSSRLARRAPRHPGRHTYFVTGLSHLATRRAPLTCLLRGDDEVTAPVLLPAGFVFLGAEGLLLALADDGDAGGGHAEVDQVLLHGLRSPGAQRQVVLGAAARVAMTLDSDLRARPALEPVPVVLQRRAP